MGLVRQSGFICGEVLRGKLKLIVIIRDCKRFTAVIVFGGKYYNVIVC